MVRLNVRNNGGTVDLHDTQTGFSCNFGSYPTGMEAVSATLVGRCGIVVKRADNAFEVFEYNNFVPQHKWTRYSEEEAHRMAANLGGDDGKKCGNKDDNEGGGRDRGESKRRDEDDGGGGGGGRSGGEGCVKTIIRWFLYLVLASIILIVVGIVVSSECGWHYEGSNKSTTPSATNTPAQQKPVESVQSSAKSFTDGCSFTELKTPPLVTFSSTDEDSKSWDEGWDDIKLYVNPQTKDSILIMESYGGMGKRAYKFVFNKNLTDAEVTLCCFGSVESSLCGEKNTLKTSKDAEKELREAFQTARGELSMKLSGSGGGNATEYVKSGTKYLDRGDKNNNKADYDLAIAEFDRAIKLDPNIAEAYFGRGRGYLRKGDNSRAVADYSQAIRLNPNDIISYSNRGRAYARMGDYDNAVADFESALRIDPNNTAIKQNLEKARKKEKGL